MKRLLNQLHNEAFVINVKQSLDQLGDLGGYQWQRRDEYTLEVEVKSGQSVNGLFQMLAERGIEVASLRNKQNRLEQLFIDMVESSRKRVQP